MTPVRTTCRQGHDFETVGVCVGTHKNGRTYRTCKACHEETQKRKNRKRKYAQKMAKLLKHPSAQLAISERARVLAMREKHGEQWWKQCA